MNMNIITFPAWNIHLEINKTFLTIGNLKIEWYGLLIVFAILICLFLGKKDNGKYHISFETILELFILILPISFIGARIYYVFFKWDYYATHLLEIFSISSGGLAIYGAILAACLTIFIYTTKNKINFLDILDYIAPYLALGQAIGRWGNFFNQEAYGYETSNLFRMGIIENGSYLEVHPTFLYESISCFLIFLFLYKRKNKRKYKGQITYLYFASYSFIRMIIEGLRTDSLMLGNFRISQILSFILWVIFTLLLIRRRQYEKK